MHPKTAEEPAIGAPDALSRLRHDIKGALSPALLAADMLAGSPDERTRRNAQIIIDAIESAVRLLSGPAR
jgi:hypothetical protein